MIRRSVAVFGLMAALALSGCASDDWEGRYTELHGEMIDMASERDNARRDAADAFVDLEALQAKYELTERELADSQLMSAEAIDRAASYADEVARLKDDQTATLPTPTGKIDVTPAIDALIGRNIDAHVNSDGDVEIRIPADVTFSAGEAALTKSGRAAIRNIAPELTGEFADCEIRVVGHTDSDKLVRTIKKWGDNRGLGGARANAVTQYLESQFGIAPTRISSISRGATEPLAPNTTKANKALNRRVAIIVVMPRAVAMSK